MTTAAAIAHHDCQAGVFLTLASLAEQRGDQVAADAHTAAYNFEKEWADEL